MSPVNLFFKWPTGGVYSNIVASAIWTTPSFIAGLMVGHFRMKKHIMKIHKHLGIK